jgi:hypothetical protein
MSNTPGDTTNTSVLFDETTLKLDDTNFDAIYQAELKAARGDGSEAKKLVKELFTAPSPEPEKKEDAPPAVEDATNTESVAETTQTATDGGDSTNTNSEATPTTEPEERFVTLKEASEWLKGLDPDARDKVNKLIQQKYKSDEGRVAQYQHHFETANERAARLEQELQKYKQQNKPQATTAAATSTTSGTTTATKPIRQKIEKVKEVDPELGSIFSELDEEHQRELNALREELNSVGTLREQLEDLRIERELELLEKDVPGAREILAHPIWDDFKANCPPALRRLAESSNRHEVATAIHEYGNWINHPQVQAWAAARYGAPDNNGANTTQQQQPNATTATTTATSHQPDPEQVAKAQKVKQEAERKSQTTPVNTAATGRPTARKPTEEEILADPVLRQKHFDEIFQAEYRKARGLK